MSDSALHGFSQRVQVSFALFALLALAIAGLAVHGGAPSLSLPQKAEQSAAGDYGKLPLAFVPNRGQTDKSVRYYTQGAGHSFYFTPDKAVLSFTKKDKGVTLDLTPLGASPSTKLVATERAPGKVNYLVGSEQHRNLPTYNQLAYRNVWPGIDLVFRGQGGTLKYELRAQAGADLSRIALAYGGADGLSVGKGGNLLIQTPLGTLQDARPRSYQPVGGKHVPIQSRYAVKSRGNAYGFALGGSYDPRHPLVIDPGIEYSTFIGGASDDLAYGLAVDAAGSAYVTGRTASSAFPATAGAFDTSFNAGGDNIYTQFGDAFVAKLNPNGSALVYATYLGGSTAGDAASAIAVNEAGNAYITGYTGSTDFPTTAGAYDTTYNGASNGGTNAFVTKLSADGSSLEYSTYLAGSVTQGFGDGASAIAVDGTGAAYVAGSTHTATFPTTPGAYDRTHNGNDDVFVTKLNPAGSALAYSTLIGGARYDFANALAIDGAGNTYIAGYVDGDGGGYPTTAGAYDTSFNGNYDSFVTKVNASGSNLSYSTWIGGTDYDEARGIAVDAAGSAYITGRTNLNPGQTNVQYPTTAGAYDTTYNGGHDFFVTKFDPTGSTLSYSTLLGSTNDSYDEYSEGIAIDANGSAYVTGYTKGTDFPMARATDSTYNGGTYDAVVAKLSATGQALDFSTYLGGSSEDRANAIAVNAETGRIYLAGQTSSSGFPTTAGAFDTSRAGGFDAFVTKFAPIGSTLTRREDPAVIQQALPDSTGYAAVGNVNVQMPSRLLGIDPGDLVAFRVGDNGWEQIPVQVDEREVMDMNRIYTTSRPTCSDPCYSNPPASDPTHQHPEFTDPNTFVGPDSNPTLDSNDEVAVMAADAGGPRTTQYAPEGVDPASAVEAKITDPLDGGVGYVYLFEDRSGIDPAAGQDYVQYQFNLTNGPYKTGAYKPNGVGAGNGMNFGPRPETSFVTTENYHRGFTDRWYDNELRVTRGSATGVDILDRHDDQFDAADASCVRTQDTFRQGEGAFIVNKDGPVRAIRDFIGANSGPHVQREHIFYDKLEVINTYLRVHPIPGVVDFFDYSAAADGLTYENGVQTPNGVVSGTPTGGVTIDGQQDAVTGAGTSLLPGFESVDGPQGALTMTQRLQTNNPDPAYHLVYRDGNLLGPNPCTGDDNTLYGASGPQLNSAVNNTDEAGRTQWGGGQFSNLFYERDIYYGAPGQANGPQRLAEVQAPLQISLQGITLSEVPADISLSQADSPDPVSVGGSLTYTLGVTNNGPATARSVGLTDLLPKNVRVRSARSDHGRCAQRTQRRIECNLVGLASGETAGVTIVVRPTKQGTIVNTATVSASQPVDGVPANNTAIATTSVLP